MRFWNTPTPEGEKLCSENGNLNSLDVLRSSTEVEGSPLEIDTLPSERSIPSQVSQDGEKSRFQPSDDHLNSYNILVPKVEKKQEGLTLQAASQKVWIELINFFSTAEIIGTKNSFFLIFTVNGKKVNGSSFEIEFDAFLEKEVKKQLSEDESDFFSSSIKNNEIFSLIKSVLELEYFEGYQGEKPFFINKSFGILGVDQTLQKLTEVYNKLPDRNYSPGFEISSDSEVKGETKKIKAKATVLGESQTDNTEVIFTPRKESQGNDGGLPVLCESGENDKKENRILQSSSLPPSWPPFFYFNNPKEKASMSYIFTSFLTLYFQFRTFLDKVLGGDFSDLKGFCERGASLFHFTARKEEEWIEMQNMEVRTNTDPKS